MLQVKELPPFTRRNSELRARLKPLDLKAAPSAKLLRSNIRFGVEIETEGWKSSPAQTAGLAPWWEFKADGSLRGDDAVESVTTPLQGRRLVAGVTKFCKTLRGCKKPFSYRCSTHLHMNVLDLPVDKLEVLILLTLCADNFFFAAGEAERASNYNCRPISLMGEEIEELARASVDISHHMRSGQYDVILGDRNRYVGVNWAALWKFGTVEFRHFPGNADADKIIWWINLCQQLYIFSEQHTLKEVIDLVAAGIEAFGTAVFSKEFKKLRYDADVMDWGEVVGLMLLFKQTHKTLRLRHEAKTITFDAALRQKYVYIGD